jgi:hypothetical protein
MWCIAFKGRLVNFNSSMKVFISWSGKPSLQVATVLKDWLKDLFNGVDFFLSTEDIRKGKQWPLVISKELETTDFGIVCLTSENRQSPWIVFEAGALSKFIEKSSVFTLLLGGLKPSDVDGPLSHFQHTLFDKSDFFKLIQEIDATQGKLKREEARLLKLFDAFWPELVKKVDEAFKNHVEPKKGKGTDEMLREILDTVTSLARNSPSLPGLLDEVNKRYGSPLIADYDRQNQLSMGATFLKNQRAAALHFKFVDALMSIDKSLASKIRNFSVRPVFDIDNKELTLYFSEKRQLQSFNGKDLYPLTKALQNIGLVKWTVSLDSERKDPHFI